MTHYLRTISSTDVLEFPTEAAAVEHVQVNIARQKSLGRGASRDGERVLFHEKNGALIDGMWVEDEDGMQSHIPF